jgi:hypothetical protein
MQTRSRGRLPVCAAGVKLRRAARIVVAVFSTRRCPPHHGAQQIVTREANTVSVPGASTGAHETLVGVPVTYS